VRLFDEFYIFQICFVFGIVYNQTAKLILNLLRTPKESPKASAFYQFVGFKPSCFLLFAVELDGARRRNSHVLHDNEEYTPKSLVGDPGN
jgi:hypothetical protein